MLVDLRECRSAAITLHHPITLRSVLASNAANA